MSENFVEFEVLPNESSLSNLLPDAVENNEVLLIDHLDFATATEADLLGSTNIFDNLSSLFSGGYEVTNESNLNNLLTNPVLIGDIVLEPENLTPTTALTEIGIPVHDNLLVTVNSLNDNSPSNSGILAEYESIPSIPAIPPGDGSLFPTDPSLWPRITTVEELLKYLSEIMIRFSSNPDYYMQDDYKLLIYTISNAFIFLYTAPSNDSTIQDILISLDTKVDKVTGKQLSTHDLTDALQNLYNIAYDHSQSPHAPLDAGKNVNADWNATEGDALILNKPIVAGVNTGDETPESIESKLTGLIDSHGHTFKFVQGIESILWTITHNLGKFPSVVTTDPSNVDFTGTLNYINENVLQIEFSSPINGYAYLN